MHQEVFQQKVRPRPQACPQARQCKLAWQHPPHALWQPHQSPSRMPQGRLKVRVAWWQSDVKDHSESNPPQSSASSDGTWLQVLLSPQQRQTAVPKMRSHSSSSWAPVSALRRHFTWKITARMRQCTVMEMCLSCSSVSNPFSDLWSVHPLSLPTTCSAIQNGMRLRAHYCHDGLFIWAVHSGSPPQGQLPCSGITAKAAELQLQL